MWDCGAMSAAKLGITLPFEGVSLTEHRPLLQRLVDGGVTEIWTGEVAGLDGYGPLQLFAGWSDEITITCAVASVYTRGPALLAMTAATMAETAPGRCRFGIGAGSPVIATSWNGARFERPYQKVVDTLHFLRETLAGEKASDYQTVHGAGFRLARTVATPPKLLLGVAGPRMQDFAAADADTMTLNFVSASDVAAIRSRVADVARTVDSELEVAARIFVVPGARDGAEAAARRFLAGYLTVPTYARFQDWLGRGPALAQMHEAWGRGDRRRAVEAIPDATVRDLVVFGDPDACAVRIRAHFDAGLDVATLALLPAAQPMVPQEQVDFVTAIAGHF